MGQVRRLGRRIRLLRSISTTAGRTWIRCEPTQRASANALGVFSIHLLGDVPAPLLIGLISTHSSLQQGVKLVPLAILVSGVIWIFGALAQPAGLAATKMQGAAA